MARPEPREAPQRRQRRSQKERKRRQTAASKLQALEVLVVGFMTRRKELPAAREMVFRRGRAEDAARAIVFREEAEDATARALAVAVPMDVLSRSRPKRPAEMADQAAGRRIRPASPLASSISS